MRHNKKRVGILAMNVMGSGAFGEGIPVLTDLFSRLSMDFEIVFYSFSRLDASKVPPNIKVRQPFNIALPGRLQYLTVCAWFLFDHLRDPFSLIFAVSVFPTGKWAIPLGRLIKRPVIVQLIALEAVSLPAIGRGNLSNPWLAEITRSVCREATVLIAVAHYQKKIAEHSLPTNRRIEVLPLRINTLKFPYRERTISFPVQFIHIGYYSPIKDQDTLFAAFALLSKEIDCHLTVIGAGFDHPKVSTNLAEMGISHNVTFAGTVPQSELPSFFYSAHILIHTSVFETGCAAIQEAMASGVAVCGTYVGILADISKKYAVSAPVGDANTLAAKILQLINDNSRYKDMTSGANQWICSEDAKWASENYRSLIENVLAKQTA